MRVGCLFLLDCVMVVGWFVYMTTSLLSPESFKTHHKGEKGIEICDFTFLACSKLWDKKKGDVWQWVTNEEIAILIMYGKLTSQSRKHHKSRIR